MTDRETPLEAAKRNVAEARQIVARQRVVIDRRKQAGLDTSLSEDLLRNFEHTLVTVEDDLAAIIAESKL